MARRCGSRWPPRPILRWSQSRPIRTPSKPPKVSPALSLTLPRPGITRGDLHGKLGVRAGATGWIYFQDVQVPAENRIGEEGEGFKITMSAFDHGRYTVACGSDRHHPGLPGGQRRLRQDTPDLRQADRRAPVDPGEDRPDVAGLRDRPPAVPAVGVAARIRARRCTLQTSYRQEIRHRSLLPAANEAIQIHGAYGYSDEYDVERFCAMPAGP